MRWEVGGGRWEEMMEEGREEGGVRADGVGEEGGGRRVTTWGSPPRASES